MLDMIIPQNLRERHWEAYGKAMQSGDTRYGTGDTLAVPALPKDGTQLPVEFTILPFRDREGRSLGAAAILRDASKGHEETEGLRKELALLRGREEGNAASLG
jgi:PAS domain S-box-containing protein